LKIYGGKFINQNFHSLIQNSKLFFSFSLLPAPCPFFQFSIFNFSNLQFPHGSAPSWITSASDIWQHGMCAAEVNINGGPNVYRPVLLQCIK
jgi:hypothetical protein